MVCLFALTLALATAVSSQHSVQKFPFCAVIAICVEPSHLSLVAETLNSKVQGLTAPHLQNVPSPLQGMVILNRRLLVMTGFAAGPDFESRLTEGFADSNGVRIHYTSIGSGPLMVMVHGFPD